MFHILSILPLLYFAYEVLRQRFYHPLICSCTDTSYNSTHRRKPLWLYTAEQFGLLMNGLISVSCVKSDYSELTHWCGALSCRQICTLWGLDVTSMGCRKMHGYISEEEEVFRCIQLVTLSFPFVFLVFGSKEGR
jgi:hypothetical protein